MAPTSTRWVKINTDGAVKMTNGYAYAGAVVRDYHEDWLAGCSGNIGYTTVEEDEMWGIHDGLLLSWSLRVRQAILETDCLPAVKALTGGKADRLCTGLGRPTRALWIGRGR
ncbi:hypothetical protein PVK06_037588 [Gossypium arboreum]|uniref:RNase H type-1 domain-containing protein n=1 Tax=Gossypium arboreum TaxID=29729 RepID=A0ABR0MXR8_GOSAR|nr:hypothetical protein PVK06_037588 [Gossypium arboreum]